VFADPADGGADAVGADADEVGADADEVGAGARGGPAGPAGAQPATSTAATGARARRYRSLRPERRRLFDIRERYALAGRAPPPAGSRPEIVTSWARSPGGPAARRRILDARPPCRGCRRPRSKRRYPHQGTADDRTPFLGSRRRADNRSEDTMADEKVEEQEEVSIELVEESTETEQYVFVRIRLIK